MRNIIAAVALLSLLPVSVEAGIRDQYNDTQRRIEDAHRGCEKLRGVAQFDSIPTNLTSALGDKKGKTRVYVDRVGNISFLSHGSDGKCKQYQPGHQVNVEFRCNDAYGSMCVYHIEDEGLVGYFQSYSLSGHQQVDRKVFPFR